MNGIIQDKQVFLETRVSMKGIGGSASFSQPSLMPKKKISPKHRSVPQTSSPKVFLWFAYFQDISDHFFQHTVLTKPRKSFCS